jgi:hypothetical protein
LEVAELSLANDDLRFSLEDSNDPLDGTNNGLRKALFFGLASDFLFRAGWSTLTFSRASLGTNLTDKLFDGYFLGLMALV